LSNPQIDPVLFSKRATCFLPLVWAAVGAGKGVVAYNEPAQAPEVTMVPLLFLPGHQDQPFLKNRYVLTVHFQCRGRITFSKHSMGSRPSSKTESTCSKCGPHGPHSNSLGPGGCILHFMAFPHGVSITKPICDSEQGKNLCQGLVQ
jgi:hypothetical protein